MTEYYELLKAIKTGYSNDYRTMLMAKAFVPSGTLAETVGSTISLTDCLPKSTKELVVYGKSEVADGQFKDVGTPKVVHGKNLINPDIVKDRYWIDQTGDFSVSGSGVYRATEKYIPIEPNTTYTFSNGHNEMYGAFYDSDKVFISWIARSGTFTTPNNAKFFRGSWRIAYPNAQLELGSEATEYEPYREKTVYEVEVKSTGKNLFDKSDVKPDTAISNGNGTEVSVANTYASEYIEVPKNSLLYVPLMGRANWGALYDSDKNFLYGIGSNTSYPMGEAINTGEARYIRVSINAPEIDVYQLELGSEATEYEPYKESTTTLQLDQPLRGIPVTDPALATYTDDNGQMWCADDSLGNVRIKRKTFTDFSDFTWTETSSNTKTYCCSLKIDAPIQAVTGISNYFKTVDDRNIDEESVFFISLMEGSSYDGIYMAIRVNKDRGNNFASAMKNLTSSIPFEIIYRANETKTEIEQPKLQLHKGENNISNNQDAWMSVKYLKK